MCLGCGLIVDEPGEWGCKCPPPSIVPVSKRGASQPAPTSQGGPYRSLPPSAPCPRCSGRLEPTQFHDATVLDCTGCRGLYLPRHVIDALTRPDGKALRLAFPHREREPEPIQVRYLKCPTCDGVMNRQNFGEVSGVVVDVCSDHGIWFDAGEVNAVIDFVEKGGLEMAERRKRERFDREMARDTKRLKRERIDAARAPRGVPGVLDRREDPLIEILLSWLGR